MLILTTTKVILRIQKYGVVNVITILIGVLGSFTEYSA